MPVMVAVGSEIVVLIGRWLATNDGKLICFDREKLEKAYEVVFCFWLGHHQMWSL
jgi:hypothetical protein